MRIIRHTIAAVAVALVASLTAVGAPARAEGDGPVVISPPATVSVSGTVTGAGSITGYAQVTAYNWARNCWTGDDSVEVCDDYWSWQASADIDPTTGAFTVGVFPNTTVRLVAEGSSFIANALGRTPTATPGGASDGADLVVGEEAISGLEIAVLPKPRISGTVTLPAQALTGSPFTGFSDMAVYAYSYRAPNHEIEDAGGWSLAGAVDFPVDGRSETMTYSLSLDPGTYRLSFRSYWTGEQFFGGTTVDDAADVVLTPGSDAIVDFTATLLPVASGSLTAPDGVALDRDLFIVLVNPADLGGTTNEPVRDRFYFGSISEDGTFRIPVTPGEYVLIAAGTSMFGFFGAEPECFATQGFDGGCTPTPFTVGPEGRSDLDIALRLFPRVVGNVTLPEDAKGSEVRAYAERWQWHEPSSPEAEGYWAWESRFDAPVKDNGDGTGNFTIYINEPGTYRLKVAGDWVTTTVVGGEDSGPDGDAFVFPTLSFSELTASMQVSGVPVITGSVNSELFGGQSVDAWVSVYAYDTNEGAWTMRGTYQVALVDGTFKVPAVAGEGEYRFGLQWVPVDEQGNPTGDYQWSWYGGPELERADEVAVSKSGASGVYFDLPHSAPGAPATAAVTSVGDGSATVEWSPPAFDGGSPITSYTARVAGTDASCTAGASETSCTITGLENLRTYSLEVVATNDVGDSEPTAAGTALPHSDEFQIWLPGGGNVARDGYASVWLFGANNATTVKVRIGTQVLDASPDENGVAILEYYAESGSFGVRSGRLRISASATSYDGEGTKQTLRASSLLVVPSTSVRTKWRSGSTVTVRTRTVAPGTELSYLVNDEVVCEATADDRGRASCTFTASDEGEYEIGTFTRGTDGPIQFDSDTFTVVAGRRTIG